MYTLIFITIIVGNSAAPMLHTASFSTLAACQQVLETSAAGAIAAFNASSSGPSRISQPVVESGWTVLRTPTGRTVAQLRCQ